MKICLISIFACVATSSPVVVNERKDVKEVYCRALNRDLVLFNGSSDHDPMKGCGRKCQSKQWKQLRKLWLPKELETKLKSKGFYDLVTYYNLQSLQSWVAGQIDTNGSCLQLDETSTTKNCKLSCVVMESAKVEIGNLLKLFDDIYFPNVKSMKKRLKKIQNKTKKVLGKPFKKYWKKSINLKKNVKRAKKVAKKTSSCLLHTESVTDKLTALC